MTDSKRAIVGHDGSAYADNALRWALDWASSVGGSVRVLRGWSMSTAPRPSTWQRGYVPPLSDFAEAVRERLEADTAAVRREFPGVEVTFEAAHQAPANAVIEASAEADIVVVGSRGMGGFKGLVLGSVSDQVVRYAKCPVVVVRDAVPSAEAGRTHTLDSSFTDD